jgi:hypothetical protein
MSAWSSASIDTGGGNARTVVRFTASSVIDPKPSRSSSTAWRKLTPFFFIAQSMGPPAAPQPKQWNRFFSGVTVSDGVSSWWKGQTPIRSRPRFSSLMPLPSISRATDTSAFSRSSSDSAIRAMRVSPCSKTGLSQKPVKRGIDKTTRPMLNTFCCWVNGPAQDGP